MRLRVLIADDEPAACERLRQCLQPEHDIEIVAECRDGNAALEGILEQRPDLAFLDVRMPELNGFDVIRSVPPASLPVVIFVTASDQFGIEAFDASAVDYLLKPFDRSRFRKALATAREKLSQHAVRRTLHAKTRQTQSVDRLAIRSQGKIVVVGVSDIGWVSGAGNCAEVHVGKTVHLLRQTLSSLEERLPEQFTRTSKSHLVNLDFVRALEPKSCGDFVITLQDGTELAASRNYRQPLRNKLNL